MSRKKYPKRMCNTCKHVIDINENQYGHSYITCECDKCEYEALVSAREILEALLDGQMVVERFPDGREIYYRLNGGEIEFKWWGGWQTCYDIPRISIEFSSIEGKKKGWRGGKKKKTEKELKV